MPRYILNTNANPPVVHRADGCWDAQEFGRRRGWRSVGVFIDLEIATIEAELLTDGMPRACPNCTD